MPKFITDDILERYAVVGLYDEIAGKLKSRYGKLVSHAEFSIPLHDPGDEEKLREMLTTLRED